MLRSVYTFRCRHRQKFIILSMLMDRMGSAFILSIKVPVAIGIMLNFDGDGYRIGTCKHSLINMEFRLSPTTFNFLFVFREHQLLVKVLIRYFRHRHVVWTWSFSKFLLVAPRSSPWNMAYMQCRFLKKKKRFMFCRTNKDILTLTASAGLCVGKRKFCCFDFELSESRSQVRLMRREHLLHVRSVHHWEFVLQVDLLSWK